MHLHKNQFSGTKGAALLIVLSVLSLLIVIVLGLLTLTNNEKRASTAFADTVDSRALSELAVDLAIAQIRKATEENSPESRPSGGNSQQFQTWASQPGMIRVFGTEEDESGVRAKTGSSLQTLLR